MKRFTKVCLVLGILLLVAGLAVGIVSYGLGAEKDIRGALNPPTPETEEIMIPGSELGRLEVSLISDDVRVEVSRDGNAHIRYPVSEETQYEYQTDEGKIRGLDACTFRAETLESGYWFRLDLIRTDWPPVTISLPADYDGELKIRTVSGDIKIQEITAGNSEFITTSGDIWLSDVSVGGTADISDTSGEVVLENVQASSACEVKTISGDIRARGGTFTRYQVSTTSGEIRAEGITSADWMHLQTISGEVTVRSSTITQLECKTISGDIEVRNNDKIGQFQCSTTSGTVTTDDSPAAGSDPD